MYSMARAPFKETLGVLSHGLYDVIIKKKSSSYMIHPFLASVCPSFVSRTLEAHCSTLSQSSLWIGKVNCAVESKLSRGEHQNNYWNNGFFLEQDVEENVGKIRRVISNVHYGTVEDVVQALKHDKLCCKMQLTSQLVDAVLHKYGCDWKSALGFFQWANLQSDYKHTSHSCNMMVDLLGKMKQIDRMWDVVNEMHGRGFVTLETIAKIMRRLAGAGRWKDIIKVFDDISSLGLEKNTVSMNLLLDTLCKDKKVDVGWEVYLEQKAQIPPDDITFNILVNGWCNSRRIDEALWTIQEMKNCGFHPSVVTYSAIIEAYCNQFKFSKAYDLLDEMAANGCPPNVVTYTIIMHSLARACKFEEAFSIVEKMKLSGCKPDALFYNSLISILGRAGHVCEASQIFELEMQLNGVDRNLSTYNTMITIFCLHNQEEDALGVLKEMGISCCRPVLQTYFPLLKLCFKTGKIDDQLNNLLCDIVNKHHLSLDLDTYTLLIRGLCNGGKIEWACQLFDEMTSREIWPKDGTLKMLMHGAEQKNMLGVLEKVKCLMQ